MLEIKNLKFSYDQNKRKNSNSLKTNEQKNKTSWRNTKTSEEALHNSTQQEFCFNLTAQAKQIKLISGASGAGKTTLLNLIAGLLQQSSGQILYKGEDISNLSPWLRPVSILFQDQNLFAHLSAIENIGLGIDVNLRKALKQKQKILQALNKVGLDETYAHKLPHQLSGGQKQRIALARSIVSAKKILLLDEPFTGLDKKLRDEFAETLAQLVEQEELICLFVSHHKDEMPHFATTYELAEN